MSGGPLGLLRLAIVLSLLFGSDVLAAQESVLCLVVGNNENIGQGGPPLEHADDDAVAAARRCRILFPDAKLWLLTRLDEPSRRMNPDIAALVPVSPTLQHWNDALGAMRREVALVRQQRSRVRLFVHFSGHGEENGDLNLADRLLPGETFIDALDGVGADKTFLFLDGCYLALVARGAGQADPAALTVAGKLQTRRTVHPMYPIASIRQSHESTRLQSGLLTSAITSGLLGPADLNQDQRITYWELWQYVSRELVLLGATSELKSYPDRRDDLAVLVDFRSVRLGGLQLEPSFPGSTVQVRQRYGPNRWRPMAIVHHDSGRPMRLALPPGDYQLLLLATEVVAGPDSSLSARQVTVTVKRDIVRLNDATPQDRVDLVARSGSGVETEAEEGQVEISPEELRALEHRPARPVPRLESGPPPTWSVFGLVYAPGFGPILGAVGEPSSSFAAGAAQIWPVVNVDRFFVGAGPMIQYGQIPVQDLQVSHAAQPVGAQRHELRVGITLQQTWVAPWLRMTLEESIAYAPGLVSSGGALLEDPTTPGALWRYRLLWNVAGGIRLSIRMPLGRFFEIGPAVEMEVLRYQLPPPAVVGPAAVEYIPQLAVGLELRQNPFSGGRRTH